MALISSQNFVAPFKNKTHLFTIVVFAAIFGLWRATGGDISVTQPEYFEKRRAQQSERRAVGEQQLQQRNRPLPQGGIASPRRNGAGNGSDVGSLLRRELRQEPQSPPSRAKRSPSALDDIEKTLGMR
ncbi:hypothetical protein MRY87_10705 [bacterium]|nr:hypothetical protein [bacterium]